MSREKYAKVFLSAFQLSACTFGGGFVIISLMRKKFVEELHWIEENEMLDLTAIAQAAPGAVAVNASILVGYRIAGVVGALVTVLGTVLPPLIIISFVSLFYQFFRNNVIIDMAMKGMLAGIAAVISDVVLTIAKDILKQKQLYSMVLLAAAFIAVCVYDVNIIMIISGCGILGGVMVLYQERREQKHDLS